MEKRCFIVGACKDSQSEFEYSKGDFIIGCDGGVAFLEKHGYPIDLIIGDFDSLGYVPSYKNIITLNPIKDVTDLHVALNKAHELGYKNVEVYGCIGGRIEHSFASIQDGIYFSSLGMNITFHSKDNIIKIIHNEKIEIEKDKGFISVFAYRDAKGVTIKNLKYEVDNVTLSDNFPLGVSNEFVNKKATIKVDDGYLIIVY